MKFKIFIILFCITLYNGVNAQLQQQYEHSGEYGASVGLGHYFGDLNPNAALNHPKFSAGIFYLKQLNNYVSYKLSGNYIFLGYSDAYSTNPVQHLRNLSFNTDIYEASISGNFNFFKYFPELPEYRFTPYISLGIGGIYFNPYTFLNGKKVYLQPLGTEGQGNTAAAKKKYSKFAMVVPIGIGMKYNITDELNIFGELIYRFTTTDYLDDVSGTYAGTDAFVDGSVAQKLQDRSYQYGNIIGLPGRQRGNTKQTDAYATFQIGVSVNIQTYRCPTFK